MQHKYAWLLLVGVGCSGSASTDAQSLHGRHRGWENPHAHRLHLGGGDASAADAGVDDASTSTDDASTTVADSGTTTADSGTTTTTDSGTTTVDSGTTTTTDSGTSQVPNGWLYTQNGKIYVSNGTSGTQWMGRGVNADDLFFCGYNSSLSMTNAESTLDTLMSGLLSGWKPTFVRVSLSMASYANVSWTSGNAATYKTPMTNVIDTLGATPGVYVLVTLRSDTTMTNYGTDDATYFPTSATDAVYTALVDSFANSKFVLFGVTNEPGGNSLSNATLRAGMDHVVGVIRAEENKLGVPHHVVSVQGNNWTSDISFYAQSPLSWDNVVYEVHGYPPPASSYTYSNIPVIIGEYGSLTNPSAFFADIESKQIPSTAWDFDSFSNCAPDLLQVNQSATNLVPSSWGSTVQSYLLAH
jgi:hypothetical protein